MSKEQRLSQFLAQRDGVKARTNKAFTGLQKLVGTAGLFDGITKTYERKNEDGETYPPQSVKVRLRSVEALESLRELVSEQFDAEATVDNGNCSARADVVVDGAVLLEKVPVTTLLTLERDLKQVREFINSLPVLDPAHDWEFDTAAGVYKTDELRTNRTAKVQEALVLYPATDKHPAQTQMITVDKVVGEWVTVQSSGALPHDEKKRMLKRCDTLLDAVKSAREEANSIKTPAVQIGAKLFDYILG